MATPEFEEQLKDRHRHERQEEMDAIAIYGSRTAFPPIAGSFIDPRQPVEVTTISVTEPVLGHED